MWVLLERFTEKPPLDILPEWKSEVDPALKREGKDSLMPIFGQELFEMAIKKAYKELSGMSVKDLVAARMDKYANMGVFKG